MTNINDEEHISNGRCPNYALSWENKDNNIHWPNSHDYYLGNGMNITDGTRELREILSERLLNGIDTKNLLFCYLEGVLADFEKGVEEKFNKKIDDIKPSTLWSLINKSPTFFEKLPWTPKGKELWDKIKEYQPIILTGPTTRCPTSTEQKIKWCQRELCPDVKVITCITKDKIKYCFGRSILIDDRLIILEEWKDKGGKCILYDEDKFMQIYTHLEDIDENIEFTV
jgi:5'(3')-deoxyribonucleotidase